MKKFFVFFGVLFGLLLILFGTFNPIKKQELTDDIVALVDDHPILKSDLDLALKALSMNKNNQVTNDQIQLVKDKLIDEQLLLQRGIDLDLHQTSNPIRKLIVNSMIDSILSENNDFLIKDGDLKKFYNDNSLKKIPYYSNKWNNYSTIVTWYLWASYDEQPLYI